jgi:hypothetical protein
MAESMAAWEDVVAAFQRLVNGTQFHGTWRSDDDIANILRDRCSTSTTPQLLNHAIGREFKGKILTSLDNNLNDTGFMRIARNHILTANGSKRKVSFYYIHKKTRAINDMVVIPTKTAQFQKYYDENRFKGSPTKRQLLGARLEQESNSKRSRQDCNPEGGEVNAVTPGMEETTDSQKSVAGGEEETNVSLSQVTDTTQDDDRDVETAESQESVSTVSEEIAPPGIEETGEESEVNTWEHGRTRILFGITNGNVRIFLQERIDRLENVINRKGLSIDAILTTPYKGAPQLPVRAALDINLKAMYLHLAYKTAIDEYEVTRGTTFRKCCQHAIDELASVGIKHVTGWRTIMRWNQEFRVQGRFIHPYEDEKESQPFIFRDFPEAKDFAIIDLEIDLEKLSTVSALQYF